MAPNGVGRQVHARTRQCSPAARPPTPQSDPPVDGRPSDSPVTLSRPSDRRVRTTSGQQLRARIRRSAEPASPDSSRHWGARLDWGVGPRHRGWPEWWRRARSPSRARILPHTVTTHEAPRNRARAGWPRGQRDNPDDRDQRPARRLRHRRLCGSHASGQSGRGSQAPTGARRSPVIGTATSSNRNAPVASCPG